MGLRSLCAGLALVSACAMQDGGDEIGDDQLDIVGGTLTTGDPDVALLYREYDDGSGSLCTGTLVSSRVLVTATHCVLPPPPEQTVTRWVAYFGSDARAGNTDPVSLGAVDIVEEVHDESFSLDSLEAGHDFAMVLLASPAPIAPAHAINRAPLEGLVGQPVRYVGWGLGVYGDQSTQAVKREGASTLEGVTSMLVESGSAEVNNCRGDSGGPVFMTIEGQEVIIGVSSYGDTECKDYAFHTRIDNAYDDDVDRYTASADPATCEADYRCVEGCDDPDCEAGGEGGDAAGDDDLDDDDGDGSGGGTGGDVVGGCGAAGGGASGGGVLLLAMAIALRRRDSRSGGAGTAGRSRSAG